MVGEHVKHAVVGCVATAPQPSAFVVAGVRCALSFVDASDVDGRGSTVSSLDAVAIRVVEEGRQRGRPLLHFGQAVFVVEVDDNRHAGVSSVFSCLWDVRQETRPFAELWPWHYPDTSLRIGVFLGRPVRSPKQISDDMTPCSIWQYQRFIRRQFFAIG